MSALDLLGPYKWVAIAVAIVAALGGVGALEAHVEGIGYDKAAHVYQASIDKQKAEAAATLASETARVHAAEAALQDFTNSRNENDQVNEGALDILAGKSVALRNAVDQLRDPHAAGCGSGSGSSTSQAATGAQAGAGDGAAAGGLVSKPLSDLLFELKDAGDRINLAYICCRADIYKVRAP